MERIHGKNLVFVQEKTNIHFYLCDISGQEHARCEPRQTFDNDVDDDIVNVTNVSWKVITRFMSIQVYFTPISAKTGKYRTICFFTLPNPSHPNNMHPLIIIKLAKYLTIIFSPLVIPIS